MIFLIILYMVGATLITGTSYALGVLSILFNLPEVIVRLSEFFSGIFGLFNW